MVEFALCVPVLVLLIAGLVTLSTALQERIWFEQTAYQAAYAGMEDPDGGINQANNVLIKMKNDYLLLGDRSKLVTESQSPSSTPAVSYKGGKIAINYQATVKELPLGKQPIPMKSSFQASTLVEQYSFNPADAQYFANGSDTYDCCGNKNANATSCVSNSIYATCSADQMGIYLSPQFGLTGP